MGPGRGDDGGDGPPPSSPSRNNNNIIHGGGISAYRPRPLTPTAGFDDESAIMPSRTRRRDQEVGSVIRNDDDGAADGSNNSQLQRRRQQQQMTPPEHAVVLGRTLLPFPLAQAVTLTTRSASIMFRLGTTVGGYTFGATKAATLSGFDLSRVILEGILSRAGKDVLAANRTEFGRLETENMLETGLAAIHRTIAGAAFFTATGFQIVGTAASNMHDVTQLLLSFVDQLLGTTESSRAIASIFTLIRREFQNPATGVEGERVGIIDLFFGLCGMAYLQRWCSDLIEDENRRLEVDEVVWDVVVATDETYDLPSNSDYAQPNQQQMSTMESATNNTIINAIQSHSAQQSGDEGDDLPEVHLKNQILRSLPDEAKVSIVTETNTSKTITVDVSGTSPPALSPPPGVELIEHGQQQDGGPDAGGPTYRFVYRIERNTLRTVDMRRNDGVEIKTAKPTGFVVEPLQDSSTECDNEDNRDDDDGDDEDEMDDALELRPQVPPKSPGTIRTSAAAAAAAAAATATSANNTSRIPVAQPSSPPTCTTPTLPRTSQLLVASPTTSKSPESANQKRLRAPLKPSQSSASIFGTGKPPQKKAKTDHQPPNGNGTTSKKHSGFRTAFKKGAGPALSSFLKRDSSDTDNPPTAHVSRKAKTAPVTPVQATAPSHALNPAPNRGPPSMIPRREAPPPPNKLHASPIGKTVAARQPVVGGSGVGGGINPETMPRSSSRASYVAVHERKRDSLVSQTDTYSIHTIDGNRPISPTLLRSDVAVPGAVSPGPGPVPSMSKSRSERDMADSFGAPSSPPKHHRRARSQNPSIYTLKTSDSQASLVLSSAAYFARSAYSDGEALNGLRRTGMVSGMFPRAHLLRNIWRYMLFSSASYGSSFLKVMGISKKMSLLQVLDGSTHHELTSYAHHTESEAGSILLSSFVDPQGGSDSSGATNTGVPLVHYISLDKEAKAVVLACRGTLGFEDVLADMTCDYDDLAWRGRSYKVHKGIHASARRLLYGGDGRVLATLKAALEEYPDYGLVLCGHSLGGAVTALLGVMLSEPATTGTSFVTSAEPHHRVIAAAAASKGSSSSSSATPTQDLCLPTGRPIHVFAYGPPGTMSASLRKATRGLITSVVQGHDLVPQLSLGVLHDLQAVALAIKNDNIDAKMEIRQRLWGAFQEGLSRSWYGGADGGGRHKAGGAAGDSGTWAFAALKTLRANMLSMKLLPPGEVLTVESTRVLRREFPGGGNGNGASACGGGEGAAASGVGYHPVLGAGRPARRVVLKYVRDVEARFREVQFAGSMLTDHSPGRYEDALSLLKKGVISA